MTLHHKYANHIKSLSNCPPSSCTPAVTPAFRWVFKDMHHPNNFVPVLIIKPSRKNDLSDYLKCDGYGLSFFDSSVNARKKYHAILLNHPNFPLRVGDHLAEGMIEHKDGVVTPVNREGHF